MPKTVAKRQASGRAARFLDRARKQREAEPRELLELERKLRRAVEANRDLQARHNAALKQLEQLDERLEFVLGLRDTGRLRAWRPPKRVKHGSATAILLLSDWHAEELVVPEEINGLNEYNLEIADRTARNVFNRALLLLEDARNLANVRSMVVWLGGDFISGHIHPELAERNQLAPLPACRWVKQRIEAGLRLLLDHGDLDELLVATSYGNHGRDTPKPRSGGAADRSYEQDLYLTLREGMDHKLLRWQIGVGYHNLVDIQGSLCRFHHGDKIRYAGGVGGISIPINKAIEKWDTGIEADYDFIGHWHQFLWGGHWVTNGCAIGWSAHSIDLKASFQPPYQGFCVIDRDRGLTRVLPVFCR